MSFGLYLFDYQPAIVKETYTNYIVFCNISDKKRRERYRARIGRIRFQQKVFHQVAAREEKDLIVTGRGMTQGHWFKCPNGERVKVILL